jgi:hypothetical protein
MCSRRTEAAIQRFFGCCSEQGNDPFEAVANCGEEPMRADESALDDIDGQAAA